MTPSNLSQLSSCSYKIQENYKAYHLTYATLLQKTICLSRSPVELIAILGSSIHFQYSVYTPGRLMHVKKMQQLLKAMTVQASFLYFKPTNIISLEACKSLVILYIFLNIDISVYRMIAHYLSVYLKWKFIRIKSLVYHKHKIDNGKSHILSPELFLCFRENATDLMILLKFVEAVKKRERLSAENITRSASLLSLSSFSDILKRMNLFTMQLKMIKYEIL